MKPLHFGPVCQPRVGDPGKGDNEDFWNLLVSLKTFTSWKGLRRSQETEAKLKYVAMLTGYGAERQLEGLVTSPGRETRMGMCVCACVHVHGHAYERMIGVCRPVEREV